MAFFILLLVVVNSISLLGQEQDSVKTKETEILKILENMKKMATADSLGNARKSPNDSIYLEVNQLIINETVTKLGLDFQDIFYNYWNWPPGITDPFVIVITERPVFGTNTKIEITVNDIKVFESFLQPRYDALEEIARQSIDITMQYVLNFQEVLKQLSDDDLVGSGIY
jgi:curli production assembly/transport component CsgE